MRISHDVAPERTLGAHIFSPPVPHEFRSPLLLRLRTERHHSIPAAVNSSTFGTHAFRPVPARQCFRTVNFNDFFSLLPHLPTVTVQDCALLLVSISSARSRASATRWRACVRFFFFSPPPLVAREIARAADARSRERIQGVWIGELSGLVDRDSPSPRLWLDG